MKRERDSRVVVEGTVFNIHAERRPNGQALILANVHMSDGNLGCAWIRLSEEAADYVGDQFAHDATES